MNTESGDIQIEKAGEGVDIDLVCSRTQQLLRDSLVFAATALAPILVEGDEWEVSVHIPTLCVTSQNEQSRQARRTIGLLTEEMELVQEIARHDRVREESVLARSLAANVWGADGQSFRYQRHGAEKSLTTFVFDDNSLKHQEKGASIPSTWVRSGLSTGLFLHRQINGNPDFRFPLDDQTIRTPDGMARFRHLIQTDVLHGSGCSTEELHLTSQIAALAYLQTDSIRESTTAEGHRALVRILAPPEPGETVIR